MEGESLGARQFQAGQYAEALNTFTACLGLLTTNPNTTSLKITLLFNRSACHLKLKNFAKVAEDCDSILALDPNNSKALGRKVKALCSLGHFKQALALAKKWLHDDPQNTQAHQEVKRLGIVMKALNDQETDDDGLEMSVVCERIPPDGQESAHSTISPSVTTTASLTVSTPAISATSSTNPVSTPNVHNTTAPVPNGPKVTTDRPSYSSKVKGSKGPHIKVGSGRLKPPSPHSQASDKTVNQVPANKTINRNTRPIPIRVPDKEDTKEQKISNEPESVSTEEEKKWKHRPPPRGLTAQEYSKCARSADGKGSCNLGDQCTYAHSDGELQEWKERFEIRRKALVRARSADNASYSDQILEKWMTAKNPQDVMRETIEGVNVHCNTSLTAVITSKHYTHSWLFTVTSKMCLKQAALVSEDSKERFTISLITVGPKKGQEKQKLDDNCHEWQNPNYVSGRTPNDKVYRVTVQFQTTIYGTFRQWLVLDFGSEPVLCQQMVVESSPVTDLHQLQKDLILNEQNRWDLSAITTVPFTPRVHNIDPQDEELLKKYPAPMATKFKPSETLLDHSLTVENYRTRMHHLLYIEEMAQFSSIAKFNVHTTLQLVDRFLLMPSWGSTAKYAQNGELFARMSLSEVLSEDTTHGRLILQNITSVYLAPYRAKSGSSVPNKVYEAVVEEKGKRFLFFRLSADCVSQLNLKKDTNSEFQVQFHLNRMPLCEMHLAVDLLPDVSIVFPNIVEKPTIPWSPKVHWNHQFDNKLNPKQKEAVLAMTTDLSVNLHPVLLVGPYGTGKTYTLAQATMEILKNENNRVLICTHSNSAADLYIQDYLHPYVEDGHTEARPLRIYYQYRWLQTVSPVVRQYALVNTDDTNSGYQFRKPSQADVDAHRVIVTTLGTSRYLHHLGLPTDYFTHILLDEAAQAMECEIILPLTMAGPKTRVVLAGDHMQLSPEVHSCFARDRNLHMSLLERLYELYPPDNHCCILLCENYRSHKAIIDFTSELFYNNKLVASGNQKKHPMFYPLTFFTAQGEDEQHQNSTNFCNNAEVYEVVERVEELQSQWPKTWGSLDDSSIGVVAPYSDQVQRIRAELRKRKMFRVSVERVMNVQGKQFRVIFLSTVRTKSTCSRDPDVEDILDYGFLSNVKLLNTAITRAQSLVAVVGDPVSLCSVGKCRKIWERFVEICNQNDSLHGITYKNLWALLDGVEIKKSYVLNPLAPEFVPNRLRHGSYTPPEPIAVGKYGHTFTCGPAPMFPGQALPGFRSQSLTPSSALGLSSPHRFPVIPSQMPLLYQLMGLQSMYPMLHPAYYGLRPRTMYGLALAQKTPPQHMTGVPRMSSPRAARRQHSAASDKLIEGSGSPYEGSPLIPMSSVGPVPYMPPLPPYTGLQSVQPQMSMPPYVNKFMGNPALVVNSGRTGSPAPPTSQVTALPNLHVDTNTDKKDSSGSNTPTIQFLPTACNVRSPSASPRSSLTPNQACNQPQKSNNTRNALLQLELLSYMQQTEGSEAAGSYLASITSPPAASNKPTSISKIKPAEGLRAATNWDDRSTGSPIFYNHTTWAAPDLERVGASDGVGGKDDLPSLIPIEKEFQGFENQGSALKEGTFFCSDLEQEMCSDSVEGSSSSGGEASLDSTVTNMMSFLDDGPDDKNAKKTSTPVPPVTLLLNHSDSIPDSSTNDRPRPLYLRRPQAKQTEMASTVTSQTESTEPADVLSYATALQSDSTDKPAPFPVSPSQIPLATPVTPCVESRLSNPFFTVSNGSTESPSEAKEESEGDEDPLEVLRNLNIKPSHATEALYQYFA